MKDAQDLERFIEAQRDSYAGVIAELRAGRKTSHWMWYVFPQLAGLGRSATAGFYAIRSLQEATEYLAHPVLGPRLRECVGLVNRSGRTVDEIFGYPDNLKFHSCVSLFARATRENEVFVQALRQFFGGEEDPRTRSLLELP